MNAPVFPVRFRTGDTIRIDTRRYLVGPPGDQVRVFTEKESGIEKAFPNDALMHMVRSGRITTDAAFRALNSGVVNNLQVDWGAFSDIERLSAQQKYPFVKAVDGLPRRYQDKSKHIAPLIDAIMNDTANPFPRSERPSVRLVRGWYIRWLVAGRDIRAMVDNHRHKGNRTDRVGELVRADINKAIFKVYAPPDGPPGTKEDALREARNIILLRWEKDGLPLPNLGARKVIGKHLVSRTIDKMDQYGLTVIREGKREADLLAKAVRNGPPCSRPLEEAEVDHTRLDLMVCDNNGRLLGRPWITTIMDRHTRMILGFSISFTPPSWVSVMETLRIAIQPKDHLLESVCRAIGREKNFEFDWPCFGPIERLFCDNGPEFRSASMKETEIALNMQIVDLPRAAGWLKGRIERWFRALNQRLIHKLPGTTKSNPKDRGNYKSEHHADLTLNDVNWIVTKWIVDEHNSENHSQTGESPLVLWERGIAEIGQPPAPPDDIIVPLTGKVIHRKLTGDGIFWKRLRWQSNAFSALHNRMGTHHRANPVTVRIDPLDLNRVFILDPTRPGERDSWMEGLLETDDPNISGMTLYQYEHYRKTELDARPVFDRTRALAQARSNREIFDHVESRKRSKKKVPAKLARLMTDGRNASEHVRGARVAPDESEYALASHNHHDPRLLSPPPDERGPYRGRSPTPVAPLERDRPVERFDPEVVNVATCRTHPSAPAATISKSRTTKMVVKMRRHLD